MNKNYQGFAPILVVVILGLLAVGGYFLLKPTTPLLEPTPKPDLPNNDASSWETYRKEQYGYTISYPQDLLLGENERTCDTYLSKPRDHGLFSVFSITISTSKCKQRVNTLFLNESDYSKASSLSVGESALFLSGSLSEELEEFEYFTRKEDITINGFNAIVLHNPLVWAFGNGQIVYLIKKSQHTYVIEALVKPEDFNSVNEILSTFEFVE